jgi:two-component system chemotaxis response regulator CheB
MRVLVVDDSVVVRRLVSDVLQESGIEVAALLSTGDDALKWLSNDANHCDAVVLDVEMPGISGLQCVARLRELGNDVPVAMFSTITGTDAEQLTAQRAGADASVKKPANVGSVLDTKKALAEELVPALERIVASKRRQQPRPVRSSLLSIPKPAPATRPAAWQAPSTAPVRTHVRRLVKPQLVVIGSSTGGPDALAKVFSGLRPDLGVPVLIAQHMPESFTKLLADRLARVANRPVELAEHGAALQPGKVLVAPGGVHLSLHREGVVTRCKLSTTPDVGIYPSADILFQSAVDTFGAAVLAVVLTGMGSDGLAGSNAIHRAGGSVIAQDEESCVVWGMPRAVTEAGIADVVALDTIAHSINTRVKDRE